MTFSRRLIVSETSLWGDNAEKALDNQNPPVTRVTLLDLEQSSIDWSKYSFSSPDKVSLRDKKTIRPHQSEALEATKAGFKKNKRGKVIMACGTGKTFTSLKIAESVAKK